MHLEFLVEDESGRCFLEGIIEKILGPIGSPHTWRIHRYRFRLAMEEIESWLLGDRQAVLNAYPVAKAAVLDSYKQDSTCGTWALLADAVHAGGARSLEKQPYSVVGKLKSEWAIHITQHMDPGRNVSPSFRKFVEGLQKLSS